MTSTELSVVGQRVDFTAESVAQRRIAVGHNIASAEVEFYKVGHWVAPVGRRWAGSDNPAHLISADVQFRCRPEFDFRSCSGISPRRGPERIGLGRRHRRNFRRPRLAVLTKVCVEVGEMTTEIAGSACGPADRR
jgi:hypothetical protein